MDKDTKELAEDFRNALSPLFLEMQALREDIQNLNDKLDRVIELD